MTGAGAAGGAGGKAKGMSQLKMQAMALGGGAGTVAIKELAVSPGKLYFFETFLMCQLVFILSPVRPGKPYTCF